MSIADKFGQDDTRIYEGVKRSLIDFYKKYWRTAFDIGLIVITVYLIMLAFSFIYRIATPILLAFVIFYLIEPFANFLHKRKVKKSIAAAISIMFMILIIVAVIGGLGAVVTVQIIALQAAIEQNAEVIQQTVLDWIQYGQAQLNALPPGTVDELSGYLRNMSDWAAGLAGTVLSYFIGILTSFSSFIVNFSIAIILAYFLSIEIPVWRKIAQSKTPNTFKQAFNFLRDNVLKGILSYIKSQFKLISITFAIVLVSLLVLRVDNALSIALLAALFDLLPLLGVSAVFIPWIAYCFIIGDTSLGIGLSVVLVIVLLIRQLLEPKITGDSLGVSAFTVLSAMIISLSLFGIAGLVLAPILIILLKALHEQGYLKKWIHMPAEEYKDP
jgi:sporulation integral membrane protein YtvI